VLGGVRLETGEAARWLGGERGTAGAAELLATRDESAAARAGCLETSATVLAEPRARVVLGLALGTLHEGASSSLASEGRNGGPRVTARGLAWSRTPPSSCRESATLLRRAGLGWIDPHLQPPAAPAGLARLRGAQRHRDRVLEAIYPSGWRGEGGCYGRFRNSRISPRCSATRLAAALARS
jgi:hypothetical protein